MERRPLYRDPDSGYVKEVSSADSIVGGGTRELAADPAQPQAGDAWILRTLENPAGTLQAIPGGFLMITATDQNRFDLSIKTSDGVKRVQMK